MRRVTDLAFASIIGVAIVLSSASVVRAGARVTHWVSTTGTASGTGSSCSNPGYVGVDQTPIVEALAAAGKGDTVHVCAGTYLFDDGIDFEASSGVSIVGDGIGRTVLDGNESHYLIYVDDSVDFSLSRLTMARGFDVYGAGLTLVDSTATVSDVEFLDNVTNGAGAGNGGAAIYVWDNTTLTVNNSRFKGNESAGNSVAGAMAIYTAAGAVSHVTVIGSEFVGNRAGQGPAIYSNDVNEHDGPVSTLTIRNSVFRENLNVSADDGGAIAHEHTNADLALLSNLFVGNGGAGYGGAAEIWNVSGKIVVERNTFRKNSATEGGALWVDVSGGARRIARNVFIQNVANVGGAVAYECESITALQMTTSMRARNTFSLNLATADRRTSNVFASEYGCD
jgi:hypothetical protein